MRNRSLGVCGVVAACLALLFKVSGEEPDIRENTETLAMVLQDFFKTDGFQVELQEIEERTQQATAT